MSYTDKNNIRGSLKNCTKYRVTTEPIKIPFPFNRTISENTHRNPVGKYLSHQFSKESNGSDSPTYSSTQSTPGGSPGSTWSLPNIAQSPFLSRKHYDSLEALMSSSPPAHVSRILKLPGAGHVPRDAIQPLSGSFSNSQNEKDEEAEEEIDSFPGNFSPRPRSRTCPESMVRRRRARMKVDRRPPSPPPCGVQVSLLSHQMSLMAVKEKLHIPDRDLPQLAETPPDDDDALEQGVEDGIRRVVNKNQK
jgi:hypothetical protein